jgi:hypothetical protein
MMNKPRSLCTFLSAIQCRIPITLGYDAVDFIREVFRGRGTKEKYSVIAMTGFSFTIPC